MIYQIQFTVPDTQTTEMTFRHSNGTDSSIIDYFFYSKTLVPHVSNLELLNELIENK